MRIGLGCMRLSTDLDRDDARALATLAAALRAGTPCLDTARAYGHDEADAGHNERLVARALAERTEPMTARVITKCGMRREGGAWLPDGRASRILEDAHASLAALGGAPIDLLLLHAPDPRTPLATTARALARAQSDGLTRRIGVSNVSRKQLAELAAHAPISAVEVALGAHDHLSLRNGVIGYCLDRGLEIFVHAPLGGPERARRLARDRVLVDIATRRGEGAAARSAVEVFLAYLLAVRPELVPIVGARRPETVASLVRACQLALTREELVVLDTRFPVLGALRSPRRVATSKGEVVLMVGVPGAGKSRAAEAFVARGYHRLNRDTLGGTLRGIVRRLDECLRDGADRVVLDNTYVTRATRSDILRVAHGRGAAVRCVFFDTPPHEAQLNVVHRMIDRFGHVLEPHEIATRSRQDPSALPPGAVFRMARDLEPPTVDEGFVSIEVVPFVREHRTDRGGPGVALPLDLDARATLLARLAEHGPAGAACLLYAWRPGADEATLERARRFGEDIARASGRVVEVAICVHPAGPPICWCRPPLPGLWASFARRHEVDVRESVLLGTSTADRALARAVGLR